MIDYLLKTKRYKENLAQSWTRLYRIAYSWCHDKDLANDLVQDTMEKALKKRSQLKDDKAFFGWMCTILVNRWRDFLRQKSRYVVTDTADMLENQVDEEVHQEKADLVLLVHHAMKKISPEQRQVISLVDLEGFSYKEVADILDLPIGTVMSRLSRGRNQLRELLQAQSESINFSEKVTRIK